MRLSPHTWELPNEANHGHLKPASKSGNPALGNHPLLKLLYQHRTSDPRRSSGLYVPGMAPGSLRSLMQNIHTGVWNVFISCEAILFPSKKTLLPALLRGLILSPFPGCISCCKGLSMRKNKAAIFFFIAAQLSVHTAKWAYPQWCLHKLPKKMLNLTVTYTWALPPLNLILFTRQHLEVRTSKEQGRAAAGITVS